MTIIKYLPMCSAALVFSLSSHILIAQTDASYIIEQSIKYHDPTGVWETLEDTLHFAESRPDGSIRKTEFYLNNSKGSFQVNRNNEEIHGMKEDSCYITRGDFDCERAKMLRNYYLYLWGLPMKLKDPGTPVDPVSKIVKLDGEEVHQVRVPYEKDTWYFFFDKGNFRLLGYKFYPNEEETNGEVIHLEEEITLNSIVYPKKRSWYKVPGMEYLGTDNLTH